MQEALGCNSWWFHCCIASLLPNAYVWCCGLLPFAQDFFFEGTSSCSGLISPCKSLALYWPQEPSSKVKVTVLSVSLQRHLAVTSPPPQGQSSLGHHMAAGYIPLSLRYSSLLCPPCSPSRNFTCLFFKTLPPSCFSLSIAQQSFALENKDP